MGRPFLKGLSAVAFAAFGLTAFYGAFAQQGGGGAPQDELVTGLQYYAVEDIERRLVVQRGIAGSNGIAFESLSLAPNTRFRIWILTAATLNVGHVTVTTPAAGRFTIPAITPRPVGSNDTDNDGLADVVEFVLGTSPTNTDTDADGISDAAELANGSDPLDGIASATGLLASLSLPGDSLDVCAANSVAIVAHGPGISVVNVFNQMNPQVIALVPIVGTATRVACTSNGNLVAVAGGVGGLSIVDISDPPAAQVTHRLTSLQLGGNVVAVAVVDRLAYVGLNTGRLVTVDLVTGSLLEVLLLSEPIVDLAVASDFAYALTTNTLHTIALSTEGLLAVSGSAPSPLTTPPLGHVRVVVGGGVAYAIHGRGYNTFDVSTPSTPTLIAPASSPEFGWRHMALNGSGLAVAARGLSANLTEPTNDVAVYDVSDPAQTNLFQSTIDTPGAALAVAIFNGIAYVADKEAGLQVVNYLPADSAGIAPTITLSTNFNALTSIEEGQLARLTATCTDDVQVRAVEWYLDGELQVDGSFPFELFFTSPRLADQQTVNVRARVFDTGGNFTWTPTFTLQITADSSAPRVRRLVPQDAALLSQTASVVAYMNEPLDPQTLSASTFVLTEAGPDAALGTGDDVAINGGSFSFQTQQLAATRTFATPLPAGRYQAQLTTGVKDLAGLALVSTSTWTFTLYGTNATDSDGDGLPDLLEQILNLNPNNPDSDGNGTPDGDEDFDGDGLSNRGEVLLGADPTKTDSDGNGILDGAEDRDQDLLSDGQEVLLGTSPFTADTDGDGFGDGDEVTDQSDPLNPLSTPVRVAHTVVGVQNGAAPAPSDAEQVLSIQNQREPAGTNNVAEVRVSITNTAPPAATEGSVEGPSFSVQKN